jgi:hypothetical protein
MRHLKFPIASVLLLLFSAVLVSADVTVKVRQTVGGNAIESTTYIKGKRERTEQEIGPMKMVSIRQCDMKRTIRLNTMTQKFVIDSWAANDSLTETSRTVTRGPSGDTATYVRTNGVVTITISMRDTGERKKIFGFNARRLVVTTEMRSSADSCNGADSMKTETDGWYIDVDFAFDCGDNSQYEMGDQTEKRRSKPGCRDRYEVKMVGGGKLGYPVYEKVTMFDKSGKRTISFEKEVTELSYRELDASLFEAPAGYSEARDETELFTASGGFDMSSITGRDSRDRRSEVEPASSQTRQSAPPARPSAATSAAGPDGMIGKVKAAAYASEKESGKIRIGLSGVKTGAVGDGINPEMLAGAVQNLFGEFFVGTGVEIVLLEAKLPSAIENEAREAGCDFVLFATVSHKRGGGGFGALRSIGGVVGRNIPYGGSAAEQLGSDIARVAAYEVGDAAASIKAKDELTLDINLKRIDGAGALTRQYKQKATSEKENIISPTVEKAAQSIVDFATK